MLISLFSYENILNVMYEQEKSSLLMCLHEKTYELQRKNVNTNPIRKISFNVRRVPIVGVTENGLVTLIGN
jgi:hypothetical protein